MKCLFIPSFFLLLFVFFKSGDCDPESGSDLPEDLQAKVAGPGF